MALIGFARVSTISQSLAEQEKALKAFGCKKIFASKHSGRAEINQKELDKLLSYVREGDTVVVTSIDRLGRGAVQFLKTQEYFRQNNIGFVSIQQGIDTRKTNETHGIQIYFFSMLAEVERIRILERTQEGKRARIEAGDMSAIGGRPRKISQGKEKQLIKDLKKGLSLSVLAKKYDVAKSTIFNYKVRLNQEKKNE